MEPTVPAGVPRDVRGWASLGAFVVGCLAVGALSGVSTAGAVETWYPSLTKPAFNPPSWVFGPVWTVLYILMGLAAWRVWSLHGVSRARIPLGLFGIQLLLNGAWSLIFFGLQRPGLAFLEILLLLAAVALTTYVFSIHDRTAGWLMVPYLAWVTFATVLNGSIWWLNA